MEYKLDAAAMFLAADVPAARLVSPPLGMAYVPIQQWDCVYEDAVGWSRGTIFPCLDLPFLEGVCPNV